MPEIRTQVTPYLCVRDAAGMIEFYTEAFGAVELVRYTDEQGRIGHAEIRIGDSTVYLSDEHPEMGILGPESRGGTSVSFVLEVPDVDAVFARATALGATSERPVTDEPYGSHAGWLADPAGHRWSIQTPDATQPSNEEIAAQMPGYTIT